MSHANAISRRIRWATPHRSGRWLAMLVGLVAGVATVLIWRAIVHEQHQAIARTVQQAADAVKNEIFSKTQARNLALRRMARRWVADVGTPRQRWEADAESYLADFSGYQAIEWVDKTFHVRWIVPLEGNEAAQDLDLAFESHRRKALEAAKARRTMTFTHSIELVQGGKGFLTYIPIYHGDEFEGFIVGVYRIEPLLNEILDAKQIVPGYAVEIREDGQRIFQRIADPVMGLNEWAQSSDVKFERSTWRVHVWPLAQTLSQMQSPLATAFLIIGLFGSALLGTTIHLLGIARAQASDLYSTNTKLSDEVAERRDAQRLLAGQYRLLHLLQAIALAANESQDMDEAMQTTVDEVCAYTGWPIGHVYVRSREDDSHLEPTAIWHLDDPKRFETFRRVTESMAFDIGNGLPGRVLASGKPAWIEDVTLDSNFPRSKVITEISVRAAFAFPLLVAGEVAAVMEFFTDDVVEADPSLLETTAHLVRILGRVVERKRAEDGIRESEQRFDLAIQGSQNGIWDWFDVEQDEQWWSPRFYELLGYENLEILARQSTFRDWVHPDDLDRNLEAIRAHLEEEKPFDLEYRLQTKRGEYRWFHVRGVAIRDEDGKPGRMAGSIQDVHTRRTAEEALQDSEERFKLAVHGTSDGLWDWDVTTNEVWYAPRFKELLGYTDDEFPHVFQSFESRLHAQDKGPTLEAVRRHLEECQPYDVEYRLKTKADEYRWFRARGEAVRDENGEPIRMAGSIQDITDRKQAELERHRQSTAIKSALDGIATLDSQGRFIYMNEAHAKTYGYDRPEELIGQSWQVLYRSQEIAGLEKEAFAKLSQDGHWHGEMTGKKRGGALFAVEVSLTALDDGGLVCVCRDITERKQDQAAIMKKNRDLETLLYVTSHDLREPLRAIQNFSRMIHDRYADKLEDTGQDYLRRVVRGANRMDRLFDDILTLSRVQRSQVTSAAVDTNALVGDVLDRLSLRIQESQAKIYVEPDLPSLTGDRLWIVQAVYNLVANALKFTRDGQPPEVEVAAYHGKERGNGREVGLVVRDRGPGVDHGQEEKIFKLFQRAVGREVEGTGAGLAIVEQVALRHGGQVWMQPRQGGGMEFIVTFGISNHHGDA